MKKILALSLVLVLVFMAFAGCNSNNNTSSTPSSSAPAASSSASAAPSSTPAPSGDRTKIIVWTNNRHDLAYMTEVVDAFNNTNTEIEIEYVVQTENYENLITMATSAGNAPDVFGAVNAKHMRNFVDNNIIQPYNDYITDEYRKVNEVENFMYEGLTSVGDQIYAVPGGKRSGARIIYNKELVESLGLTIPTKLDEFPALAKAVTEAGNGEKFGIIFPGASGPFERWIEHSAAKSGITPYDYKNGKFDFSGYKPVLEIIRQMFDEGSVFPGSTSLKIDPARVQFAEGNVALHGNASQEVGVLTDQFPATMEWGVAELPTLDGTIKGAQQSNPNNAYMMSSITKHPDQAWKVIEYFGSEEVLKGYLEGGYTLPISTYMDNLIDKSKIGRMADFSGATYESVYPVVPNVTPEGEDWRDALWNACVSGGPDIDETIAKLNDSYNTALDNDVAMGKVQRLVIADYDPMKPNEGTFEYLDK